MPKLNRAGLLGFGRRGAAHAGALLADGHTAPALGQMRADDWIAAARHLPSVIGVFLIGRLKSRNSTLPKISDGPPIAPGEPLIASRCYTTSRDPAPCD